MKLLISTFIALCFVSTAFAQDNCNSLHRYRTNRYGDPELVQVKKNIRYCDDGSVLHGESHGTLTGLYMLKNGKRMGFSRGSNKNKICKAFGYSSFVEGTEVVKDGDLVSIGCFYANARHL